MAAWPLLYNRQARPEQRPEAVDQESIATGSTRKFSEILSGKFTLSILYYRNDTDVSALASGQAQLEVLFLGDSKVFFGVMVEVFFDAEFFPILTD